MTCRDLTRYYFRLAFTSSLIRRVGLKSSKVTDEAVNGVDEVCLTRAVAGAGVVWCGDVW